MQTFWVAVILEPLVLVISSFTNF